RYRFAPEEGRQGELAEQAGGSTRPCGRPGGPAKPEAPPPGAHAPGPPPPPEAPPPRPTSDPPPHPPPAPPPTPSTPPPPPPRLPPRHPAARLGQGWAHPRHRTVRRLPRQRYAHRRVGRGVHLRPPRGRRLPARHQRLAARTHRGRPRHRLARRGRPRDGPLLA